MRASSHDRGRRRGNARRVAASALAACGLGAASTAGAADGAVDAANGLSPGDARVLGDVPLGPDGDGWVLDLSRIDALDGAMLDARGDGLLAPDGPATIVAHEVLAGLLAWEAGRGIGDGAHAPAVTVASTASTASTVSIASFGAGEPRLGAAAAAPFGGGPRTDRRDALDLAFVGPPLGLEDVAIDAPGLRFERRSLYQATTGRLFVDFRLRHRDPVHGTAALEAEARTAEAVRRMRAASTLVVEPARAVAPGPD